MSNTGRASVPSVRDDSLAIGELDAVVGEDGIVRQRTVRTKGMSLEQDRTPDMIFKLAEAAEKCWRRLDGHNQLQKIILGVRFADGMEVRHIARPSRCRLTPTSLKFGDSSPANARHLGPGSTSRSRLDYASDGGTRTGIDILQRKT